ncbi:NINE protein [Agrococcus sp. Ld7]|uniref:NINE protein n=1 Tax=Agrococcus sp. Ld7 TaxID=649148 RepID=UPI0038669AF9
MTPIPSAPGWYDAPDGVRRWWDGQRWGIAAEHQSGTHALAQRAPMHVQQARPAPPDQQWQMPPQVPVVQAQVKLKDVGLAYVFAIFLGGFGAHRFYLGRVGSAIAMLLMWQIGVATAWLGVGLLLVVATVIWFIVDLFALRGMVRERNHQLVQEAQQMHALHGPAQQWPPLPYR